MSADRHFPAHQDHARWLAEHRAWLADIERWRDDRYALLAALDELRRELVDKTDLDVLAAEVRGHEARIGAHETAIAGHEQGGDPDEHDDAEVAHERDRVAHESFRQAHAHQADRQRKFVELLSQLRRAISLASA